MNKLTYLSLFIALLFVSCRKNGTGGKASIKGQATYNSAGVPNVVVYIKFGTTANPGTDISKYDTQASADGNGNYAFNSVLEGDYYLYAVDRTYTDPNTTYLEPLSGGMGVRVTSQKQSVTANIALSK